MDRPKWKDRLRPATWQGVGLGFVAGIVSALAHVGGLIFSFYLLPHSRTKEAFVATSVFLFFTTGLLKMGSYVYYDILNWPILLLFLALLPALFLGSVFGKWFNQRISNRLFIRLICFLVGSIGGTLVLT
jgi:uncharacterized membrane protein YfcA